MTAKLAEVCTITMGQAPTGDSYNDRGEGLPLIAGAGDFIGETPAPTKFTTKPGKISKSGDIVLSIRASIGAKVRADGEYCLGRGVAGLRPGPLLDDRYFWHWLTRYERDLAAKGRGATFPQVNKTDIGEMPIELPSLAEQRRIAAILDQADQLRTKRQQVLAQLDDLTRSTFCRAVIGAPSVTIQSMLDNRLLLVHKDGNHGSLYPRPADFGDTGVPFLTARSLRDDGSLDLDSIDRLNHVVATNLKIGWIKNEDVLLSHNASVGKVALYRGELGPAVIGTSLTCFRPDGTRLASGFLALALRDVSFQRQLRHDMAQTTRNQVPITAQRQLTVSWIEPAAQQELTSLVESIEATADRARDLANHENELSAALQFRAFRGEL